MEDLPPDFWLRELLAWLFFFGIFAIWIVPGFLFKNLARKYNKAGWVYFFVGVVVGGLSFKLSGFTLNGIKSFASINEWANLIFLIILSFLFIGVSFKLLKIYFSRTS